MTKSEISDILSSVTVDGVDFLRHRSHVHGETEWALNNKLLGAKTPMVPKIPPSDATYAGRFANRLYMLRRKAGLSAEQVAEAVGATPYTIFNWESARTAPPIGKYPILAEILGVKPRTLLPEK